VIIIKNKTNCPVCGAAEIKQGKQKGIYARMYPINSKLNIGGSDIIADICTNCGNIISMRVARPEKFR
jgi:predicted RNA-binding Zn-ribbon protein involved in translation (DUF1610 family)